MRYLNMLWLAGALICVAGAQPRRAGADHPNLSAGQEPEGPSGAHDVPLDEWEQLAEASMNIGAATTWHVDDDTCPESGLGTEADPFCLIQDCIDAAMDGDECVVAPGTYFETINFLGKAITVRSSDGAGVTTIDASGLGQVSVVTCNTSEGSNTILDGFTITGGTGTNVGANVGKKLWGGGMYNVNSSPTVTHCTFSGNTALVGDLFPPVSAPPGRGGGMFNRGGSPTVTHCVFNGNTATLGGGMSNHEDSSPTVTDCIFSANEAYVGGGIYNLTSPLTVTDCLFSVNEAVVGGGMYYYNSSLTVTNCTFSENSAGNFGGGMVNEGSSATVTNCTFSGNDADNGRALAFDSSFQQSPSDLSMTNCILWDGGDEVWNNDNSMINIAYSDVQGGWPGEGNIDADPLFIDPVNGDFRLSAGSPCIDAGDNSAVPEGTTTDLAGNPRFVDDPNTDDTGFGDPPIVDMGAYEFRDLCADDDGDGRVTICHVPPGNPDNAHTITVSVNALRAHLAHGDSCGPCKAERSTGREAGRKFGAQPGPSMSHLR